MKMRSEESLRDLYTTPPSLTFSHPCHFCGADTHVVNGQRQPHRCRIDLDQPTSKTKVA